MPKLRQAFVPQPVVDRSPSDLRAYIEGNDPVSKRPFVQEVIEGLTHPLDEQDLQGLSFERTTPRLLEPDKEENLHRLFEENRWTDFLPIVLPTEERVQAIAVDSFVATECEGMARVDFFVRPDGEPVVSEINTIPGFTATSVYARLFEASGIPYGELLDRLVQLALERHERRSGLAY